MPDALLWLGVKKIDRFISMSDMKYDALANVGIEVVTRVDIPEELVPADAKVEILPYPTPNPKPTLTLTLILTLTLT